MTSLITVVNEQNWLKNYQSPAFYFSAQFTFSIVSKLLYLYAIFKMASLSIVINKPDSLGMEFTAQAERWAQGVWSAKGYSLNKAQASRPAALGWPSSYSEAATYVQGAFLGRSFDTCAPSPLHMAI